MRDQMCVVFGQDASAIVNTADFFTLKNQSYRCKCEKLKDVVDFGSSEFSGSSYMDAERTRRHEVEQEGGKRQNK